MTRNRWRALPRERIRTRWILLRVEMIQKKMEEDELVDMLALTLDLKETVDDETYKAQLAAISFSKMLYEPHFGYSDSDQSLWGLQRLHQKMRAEKALSLRQARMRESIKS